jgi:hypothetical protein
VARNAAAIDFKSVRIQNDLERTMDKDLVRKRLAAALAAISLRKTLSDVVSAPGGRGQGTALVHALNDAVTYLSDEYFDPEGLEVARRAMVALSIECFGLRKGAIAKTILDAFFVRQARCRRKAIRRS